MAVSFVAATQNGSHALSVLNALDLTNSGASVLVTVCSFGRNRSGSANTTPGESRSISYCIIRCYNKKAGWTSLELEIPADDSRAQIAVPAEDSRTPDRINSLIDKSGFGVTKS